MALEDLYDKIIALAVKMARANSIMPRCVSMDIAGDLAMRGGTVDVPVLDQPIAPLPITPGPVPPSTARPQQRIVTVGLDYWEDASFVLTDRDITSLANRDDFIPKTLEASSAGLANRVDQTLFNCYKGVYGVAGVAGITPFGTSISAAQQAKRTLSRQNCIMVGRRSLVLDEDAMANAIGIEALQRNDPDVVKEGIVARAAGFDWHEDQNAPTHTTTGGAGFLINGARAAGSTTLAVDGGAVAPAEGDIFTIAGHTQTYVISSATLGSFAIAPALQVDVPDNAAITFMASHVVNLALNENAIAFASRVKEDALPQNVTIRRWVDDVSGLVLCLEVSREYYQTAFRLSCMWGAKLVQPRFMCRVLG